MSGVTALLPLYAFKAWTRRTLPLCICYWYTALGGLFEMGRQLQIFGPRKDEVTGEWRNGGNCITRS